MFLLRSTENILNYITLCRVLFSFVPFILDALPGPNSGEDALFR
jgi:hypothetical protein